MKQKDEDTEKNVVGSIRRQKRAVPPGYLHDLLHSRHLMKTVGLSGGQPVDNRNRGVEALRTNSKHPLSQNVGMYMRAGHQQVPRYSKTSALGNAEATRTV